MSGSERIKARCRRAAGRRGGRSTRGESHVSVCRPPRAACESASGAGRQRQNRITRGQRAEKKVCQRAAAGRAAIDKQLAGRADFGVKAAARAAVAAAVRREEEEEEEAEAKVSLVPPPRLGGAGW